MVRATKTYLIAPLDWGLGHAMRCVPIVQLLLDHNQNVVLAGSGLSLNYLSHEFPELRAIDLPGVPISFETGQGFGFKSLQLGLKFKKYVSTEFRLTEKIVRDHKIDVIISDNRYGVRCEGVRNNLITHQIYPKAPSILRYFAHKMIREQIGHFDQCWIPDYQSENENESVTRRENENESDTRGMTLSGELSHGEDLPENVHFIGPLSRFTPTNKSIEKDIDILSIVSGPEPARTDFEIQLRKLLADFPGKKVLVCGRDFGPETQENSIHLIPGLGTDELQNYIERSKKIICRSGYSTIMDLVSLNRSALVVATPGQSEQEYLATYLEEKKWFVSVSQGFLAAQLSSKLAQIPVQTFYSKQSFQTLKWLLNL
jgi:predicted glycosyltransferase